MQYKVIIAQSSPRDVGITEERFRAYGCQILGVCFNGTDALSLVRKNKPNVLIMDPFLPNLNCDEITAILEKELDYPLVKLVLTEQKNETIANRFFSSGGDLFLISPVDISFCLRQINKYLKMRVSANQPPEFDTQLRNAIKQELIRMQMPMTINGFFYIIDAVTLSFLKPELLKNMITELYPAVAKLHDVPPANVERCIRTAVEQTFERGDIHYLFPRFSHVIRPKTGKPTNGDFIAIMAQITRTNLGLD